MTTRNLLAAGQSQKIDIEKFEDSCIFAPIAGSWTKTGSAGKPKDNENTKLKGASLLLPISSTLFSPVFQLHLAWLCMGFFGIYIHKNFFQFLKGQQRQVVFACRTGLLLYHFSFLATLWFFKSPAFEKEKHLPHVALIVCRCTLHMLELNFQDCPSVWPSQKVSVYRPVYLSISHIVARILYLSWRSRAKTAPDFLLFAYATSVQIGWRDPTADGLLGVIIIDFTLDFSGSFMCILKGGLTFMECATSGPDTLGLGFWD